MKTRIKRLASLLLTIIMLSGMITSTQLTVSAADPSSVDGTCGKVTPGDIHWYAFNDRTMVFLGEGEMQDYTLDSSGFSTAPWFSADMSIVANTIFSTKIVVESGITTIGDYAFYLHPEYNNYVKMFMTISSIDLSNTVTSIGKYAFYKQEIENINIPPTVTYIGTNAFGQCAKLDSMNYYGNPADLVWEQDGGGSRFSRAVTCHILKSYAGREAEFEARFSDANLTFTADLENPYEIAEDGIERNIALYYGATNSKVFAGAAPYIVVGKFDGNKKSTTFGSNGFVSCVQYNNKYYLLTDNNGTLKEAVVDSGNGRATSCGAALADLTLNTRHEYIGDNIVKVIYTLKNNTGNELSGIKLGGSGDIKIGADDRAAVSPLKNSSNEQVGFYMSSSKDYDKDSSGDYATLGFIGEKIVVSGTDSHYPDAEFFYGKVGATLTTTAAGTRSAHVFPQRIFVKNTSESYFSHDSDAIPEGSDAGMSYHWDGITLSANESKEYAVLYSIYGNKGDGKTMIDDLTATYYTVTWQNYDGTVLQKQVVKEGATPNYTGAVPKKPQDTDYRYSFSGWSPSVSAVTSNITYTAQFASSPRPFYAYHSLTLRGDIGVNFYVDVATIPGVTVDDVRNGTHTLKLDFKWFDKHSTHTINPATDYHSVTDCFIASCNVAAAEMMYPITVTAYLDNSNTPLSGEKYTEKYRVRDYADVILNPESEFSASYSENHPDKYPKLVRLTKTMLDYGSKAQTVFDRFRDVNGDEIAPANTGVDYTMEAHAIDAGTAPDMNTSIEGRSISELGLSYVGSTMVFLTTTTLRHYYKVENQSTFDGVKNTANFTYGVNGSYIYFEKSDIPAARLDSADTYIFTIGGQSYRYSAMQFAQKMQARNRAGEYNLANALYWYSEAAKAYFL